MASCPPQTWAEKAYPKLVHYHRVEEGGHFAAWEQPQILSPELRTASGHCVDLRALAVGTERQRTQMSVEASSDSAAEPSSSFGPLRQIDAGLLSSAMSTPALPRAA